MIRIIVDSSCDFTKEEAEEKGLVFIPMEIEWNDVIYKDGVDLYGNDFYKRLESSDIIPKTSQISPAAFQEEFLKAKESGDDVICITLSSEVSGSYQSAVIASEVMPEAIIINSQNVSVGLKILVERALILREEGYSAVEIADILEKEKKEITIIGVLDTLKYLKIGGRFSGAATLAGNLLRIKPVLKLQDGKVALIGKARGLKKAENCLNKSIEETGGIDFSRPFAVGYTGTDDAKIKKYISDYKEIYNSDIEVPILQISAVIGTHAGPGAVVVGFFNNTIDLL